MKTLIVLLLLGLAGCSADSRGAVRLASASEIVGGDDVADDDVLRASTVGVYDVKTGNVVCTGTLVSENTVLTAAHCVFEDLAILFTEDFPRGRPAPESLRQVTQAKVTDQWIHRQEGQRGDLALLKFAGPLVAGFRPIHAYASRDSEINEAVFLGFGFTDLKTKARPARLQTTTLQVKKLRFSQAETQFAQEGPRGICSGDSGGPSFVRIEGEWRFFGVSSQTGANCVGPYGYSIVTRIAEFADWLRDSINEFRPDASK